MVRQDLLYDCFYYNAHQEEIESKENAKICQLQNEVYDAILAKHAKLYNQLDAKQVFYFKNKKLKRIVFIFENSDIAKIIQIIERQGYIAAIGGEAKNISALFAGFTGDSKNVKLFDFIEEKKFFAEFKTGLYKKANKSTFGIIFFNNKDVGKADCYERLYENLARDSTAIYININSSLGLVYVGFCVPKKESVESI